jgi:hypothetical protein
VDTSTPILKHLLILLAIIFATSVRVTTVQEHERSVQVEGTREEGDERVDVSTLFRTKNLIGF